MSSDTTGDDREDQAPRGLLGRLKPRPGSTVPQAALAGLLGAGTAIAVSELIAGITDRTPSLVLGVSDAIVDSRFVPSSVIRWSIDTFGSAQKPLLFYGVLAATLVLGALTGTAARRRRWVIPAVFAAFGTLGGLAANAHPTASTSIAVLSTTLAVLIGGGSLWAMIGLIAPRAVAPGGLKPKEPHPYLNETGRRWFLTAAGATTVGALAAAGIGRWLTDRRGNVEAGRASVADLLSDAEVRTDAGSATGATPTTVVGAATATSVAAGAGPDEAPGAPEPETTKPTSGPGGDTIGTAPEPTSPAAGGDGNSGGTAGAGNGTTPATTAADTTSTTAGEAPREAPAGSAAAQTPSEATADPTADPSATAGGAAPPVGDPGERAAPTTTQAPPPATTQAPPPTTQAPPPPPPPTTTQAPGPRQNRAGYYDSSVTGISPIVTPNSDFYRIDTALAVPSVDVDSWKLEITGMVDRPYSMNFRELIDMGLVETPVTLSCVSNKVGGNLVDNAVWRGVPLADVLNRAGVQRGATQIVGRSVDNWNSGFPTEYAFDGRQALVAVAMNGEPLPREHGFPARLVIAGLYGYVSATKWLEEIRLTTWEGFDSYWVPRGWSKRGPIKTQSRIDVPRGGSRIRAGRVAVAGIAWAPTRSINRVEVQVGDGPWVEADLSNNMSVNSWRQWVYAWDATPGNHRIRCRATDGTGYTQTSEIRPPAPDGATGWHTIEVNIV